MELAIYAVADSIELSKLKCNVFPHDLHFSHGKDSTIYLVQLLAQTSV